MDDKTARPAGRAVFLCHICGVFILQFFSSPRLIPAALMDFSPCCAMLNTITGKKRSVKSMNTVQNNRSLSLASGIIFVVFSLLLLICNSSVISYYGIYGVGLVPVLMPLLYLALAISLFVGRRNLFFPLCAAAIAVLSLVLYRSFWIHSYSSLFYYEILSQMPIRSFFVYLFVRTSLWKVLFLLGMILLAVFSFLQIQRKCTALWFLPGLVLGLSSLSILLFTLYYRLFCLHEYYHMPNSWFGHLFLPMLSAILLPVGTLLASYWLAHPTEAESAAFPADTPAAAGYGAPQSGYVSLLSCGLLMLFTFGIYYLIWIYRTTQYLNRTPNQPQRNPTTKLLLCLFIPFYAIYWTHQSARRVDLLARSQGLYSDLSSCCAVLAIFLSFVPPLLIQEKINTLAQQEAAAVYHAPATPPAPPAPPATPAAPHSPSPTLTPAKAEELRLCKQLLDQGILTPEEFEQKKKQLLG